jgi:hypothetical protein
MPLIPQNQYALRARQSRIALKVAAHAGARQAHARLKAACETREQADRPVLRLRGYEEPGAIDAYALASVFTAGDTHAAMIEDEIDEDDDGR